MLVSIILLGFIACRLLSGWNSDLEIFGVICILIDVFLIAIFLGMLFICVRVHIPYYRALELTRYEQRYSALEYAIKTNPDNVMTLTSEISDYNSEILNGRLKQDSIWFGILEYDFYHDLPLIQLEIK